ncbi:glycosyltransferase family 2 protein [Paenibacillus sp. 1P07SE]|uniref:glycosyltransferase family 2 protein n=1 Tax=Paenibacillus sp. 1P07SE TaxID=3132209 RepID=UPI0039A512E8
MRVFLLDAWQPSAVHRLAGYLADWEIIDVAKEPASKINEQIACLQDTFFVTLRSADRLQDGFAQLITDWVAQAEPELPGLALLRQQAQTGATPVVWRTAAVREAGFASPPGLPWRELMSAELYERLGGDRLWQLLHTDTWQPRPDQPADRQLAALARVRPLLRAAPRPSQQETAPRLSIVICTFNDAAYLPMALRSIAAQEESSWELLVVDDASTDETAAVIAPFLDDPRVQFIRHQSNTGKSGALNTALSHARAPWLLELDADDWLEPGAVSGLLRHAEAASSETAILYGPYEEWRENDQGELRYAATRSPHPTRTQLLTTGYPVAPRLYRTAYLRRLGGWLTDDPYGGRLFEDFRMLLALSKQYLLHNCGEVYYHRRVRRSGISARHTDRFASWARWIRSQGL